MDVHSTICILSNAVMGGKEREREKGEGRREREKGEGRKGRGEGEKIKIGN